MKNLLLKIKKCSVFFLLISFALLFAGCSSKPSEDDGKQAIQNQINQDAQSRIHLVEFHKTNGQLAEINAVKVYSLEFNVEIEFTEDCKWLTANTGQGYSFRTSKLIAPDNQQKTYGFSWNQFADAGQNPGTPVQKGQRIQISGMIRFEEKENGWSVDEIDLNHATLQPLAEVTKAVTKVQQMEMEAAKNPSDIQNLLQLGGAYIGMQQTNRAVELFDRALANKDVSYNEAAAIAQFYSQSGNFPKLEEALKKITTLVPDQPECHYDLAALQAVLGKNSDSLSNLKIALDLSARRLAINSTALNLLAKARTDPHFDSLRTTPEFQKLVPSN